MPHEGQPHASPKVFASDFDNTLWFGRSSEQSYHPADLHAIRRFQAAGNVFGVSTGRSLTGIRLAMARFVQPDDAVAFDFYILVNGARILDAACRPIRSLSLPLDTVRELHGRYARLGQCVIQGDDTVYTFDEPLFTQTHVDGFEQLAQVETHGISFWPAQAQDAQRIADDINRHFAGTVHAFLNSRTVDVVPEGCSKGAALDVVRAHFGARAVAAIGDSYNDLPMLERADVSFTFPYAPQSVRHKADRIVASVAEAVGAFVHDAP